MNVILNKNNQAIYYTSSTYQAWAKGNSLADPNTDQFIENITMPPESMILPTMPDIKTKAWVEGDPSSAALAKQQANIAAIKAKAGEIITARYPLWKQAQMKDRQLKLTAIMIGTRVNSQGKPLPSQKLTAEEEAELASLQDACDWIYSVKEVSDIAEQNNTPVDDIVWPK